MSNGGKTARPFEAAFSDPKPLETLFTRLGCGFGQNVYVETLPFSANDVSIGSENELQTSVIGKAGDADLPQAVRNSTYFSNLFKQAASGETSRRPINSIEKYLSGAPGDSWENSWVRFPRRFLSMFALKVFERDLLADKENPLAGPRKDRDKFIFISEGMEWLRIPMSYLLKLSLADAIGEGNYPLSVRERGMAMLDNFINDNTSPETHSFYVASSCATASAASVAADEAALRYFVSQLSVFYANAKLGLTAYGQRAVVYQSPLPPVRQRELNNLVSDSFYRELYMSPCLSGWTRGEEKQAYMHLCHEVLSRSNLNAVGKLRDAGIITRNLVVLPNTSNISLANNGAHVSMGSAKLSTALADAGSGFGPGHEKYAADLSIKIMEHFLPLFVGTYSAAPYRMDFHDFHPERAMAFLTHELAPTHLRMIWRRWRKKARLKVFNRPVTPFGPAWIDKTLDALLGFQGDYLPDYRLIDYLVCLLSTESSPAFNGELGSEDKLKNDLTRMGVFDKQMSLYHFIKARSYGRVGFSGFEGRYYSLFPSVRNDMARAVGIQNLVAMLAFKLMAKGVVTHAHIPDSPFIESERRQISFGAAIGIPTFYVRAKTDNMFLGGILRQTASIRQSGRYPGYLRVKNAEYRRALLEFITTHGSDLVELLGMRETMADLKRRLDEDGMCAHERLTGAILGMAGAKDRYKLSASEFNAAAEKYYSTTLRDEHTREGFAVVLEIFNSGSLDSEELEIVSRLTGGRPAGDYMRSVERDLLNERLDAPQLRTVTGLAITAVKVRERRLKARNKEENRAHVATPVS